MTTAGHREASYRVVMTFASDATPVWRGHLVMRNDLSPAARALEGMYGAVDSQKTFCGAEVSYNSVFTGFMGGDADVLAVAIKAMMSEKQFCARCFSTLLKGRSPQGFELIVGGVLKKVAAGA